jgi:hypothetical protein
VALGNTNAEAEGIGELGRSVVPPHPALIKPAPMTAATTMAVWRRGLLTSVDYSDTTPGGQSCTQAGAPPANGGMSAIRSCDFSTLCVATDDVSRTLAHVAMRSIPERGGQRSLARRHADERALGEGGALLPADESSGKL